MPADLVAANLELNRREVRARRVRLASAPLQVNVELTGICNINPPCLFCSGKNFGHNYAPLDASYLDKYASVLERCEHVNEDSFGEPLSHSALVATARRHIANGQRFSFVTNGLLLSREKADALAALGRRLGMHVSFNAASEDIFYKLTGKSLARVVENVRYYVASYARQNGSAAPDLILTFIVMKVNRHEVASFLRLTRELGGRALLASLHDRPSVPLGHFGYEFFVDEDEMLPYEELVRVGHDASALAAELGLECVIQWDASRDSTVRGFAEPAVDMPCLTPWRYLFIQEHTHKVFACPYHRQPYGDLAHASLEEIWNGAAAVELRASLARGEIPKYCKDYSAGCPLVMAERHAASLDQIEESVTIGENDFTHLVSGWHHLERVPDAIRWTSPVAEFLIRDAGRPWLCIEAVAFGRRSVRGRVEMEGRVLGAFDVGDGGWRELRFRLPAGSAAGQVQRGRIVTVTPWSPARVGKDGGDTRQLGIAVRRIWTERHAASLDQIEESVTVGENDLTHLVAGWHHLERVPDAIRWTSPVAEFLIRDAGRLWLCIEAVALGRRSVRGRVEMEGRVLGAFDVGDGGWRQLRFRLPASGAAGQVQRGRIVTVTPWSPGKEGGDTRQLGIAVRRIWTESTRLSRLVTWLTLSAGRSACHPVPETRH